jgi:hypothetical protein
MISTPPKTVKVKFPEIIGLVYYFPQSRAYPPFSPGYGTVLAF